MQYRSRIFFDYYEAAHQNSVNRYAHHFAHVLAVVGIIALVLAPLVGLVLVVVAFCISWTGHYFFEKNTPAFFETECLESMGETVSHHVKVALGGIAWTAACFFRLFRLGPLVKPKDLPVCKS